MIQLNKKFLLTKEEMNAVSKLITNTNIIARRACEEGYMTEEEKKETLQECDIRTSALAKLMCQMRREEVK